MSNKPSLRSAYKQLRKDISSQQRHDYLQAILVHFNTWLQLQVAPEIVLSYKAIISLGEIECQPFEDAIQHTFGDVLLAYPKVVGDNMIAVHSASPIYHQHRLGMNEIVNGHIISIDRIDWCIVPLLAFDARGYRLGYGKGYYDKYLSDKPSEMRTIGLSLFPPLQENIDIDEYDVPVDVCIAPDGIHYFLHKI